MYPKYIYLAKVINVYDGDSLTVDVDLGMFVTKQTKLRLNRINAPETRGAEREAGLVSKNHLIKLLGEGDLTIRTFKDPGDKYGRWLAELYINDKNLNTVMVEDGMAVYYNGGEN